MWPSSMRVGITSTFAILLAVVLVAACAGLLAYARRSSERTALRTLRATILRVQSDLGDGGLEKIGEMQEDEAAIRAEGVALVIRDQDGRQLWATRGPVPDAPNSSSDWIVSTARVHGLTIIAGTRQQPISQQLVRQGILLGALAVITLVVATTGAWIVVGRTLKPIHDLALQAGDASVHNLNVTLHPPSPDAEVTELVHTLNALLARIAETARLRGRFYAAASHELRTPLQALSGHLALALMRQRSPEEYRKALEEADAQTRRLVALVQDLLLLHQLEAPSTPPVNAEPADLEALCTEELKVLQPRLCARGLTVANYLHEESVLAYPGHLQILIRNILDNASKYANEGTQIEIRATRTEAGLELHVFNECAPVSEELMATLFEPFARLHAPRTGAHADGNGLGLAICHAVAQVNGWNLRATSLPRGFEITVTFPVST